MSITTIEPNTFDKIPAETRQYFIPDNHVEALFGADCCAGTSDDDIWMRLGEVVGAAQHNVDVEMYNIDRPQMVEMLCAQARRGVRVRVIEDPPDGDESAPRQAAIEQMRAAGCEVVIYPVAPTVAGGRRPLDHIKMLVVDGQTAVIGGMNWGDHSPANHDYDVAVAGPAVTRMQWLFNADWNTSGGSQQEPQPVVWQAPAGDAFVNVVVTDNEARTIGHTVLRAVDNARRSVHVEMFALTEHRVLDALKAAHARGVDVKVILDPLRIGHSAVNERAHAELSAAGVPVKWYVCDAATKQKLHAKIGIFDGDQVVVGSANWTVGGFDINHEASVEVLSCELNADFEQQFTADWVGRTADTPTYLADTP